MTKLNEMGRRIQMNLAVLFMMPIFVEISSTTSNYFKYHEVYRQRNYTEDS